MTREQALLNLKWLVDWAERRMSCEVCRCPTWGGKPFLHDNECLVPKARESLDELR